MGEQECRESLRKKVEESQIQNNQYLVFPGKRYMGMFMCLFNSLKLISKKIRTYIEAKVWTCVTYVPASHLVYPVVR